mmetsp:Transcript_168868/g.542793  ORF Transcript_168868/g.542793 Transcript_168868/m.542793 type:complete len:109 (-) Transcript_168868:448-774(-)
MKNNSLDLAILLGTRCQNSQMQLVILLQANLLQSRWRLSTVLRTMPRHTLAVTKLFARRAGTSLDRAWDQLAKAIPVASIAILAPSASVKHKTEDAFEPWCEWSLAAA